MVVVFSFEFFYLDDFCVNGAVYPQSFLNLMGDPADAPSFNFNGGQTPVFEIYAYAISGFGFHCIVLTVVVVVLFKEIL